MHHCDKNGTKNLYLDEDREVRALSDLWDNEGQLHPQAINRYPGTNPKQARQQVGEEGHIGHLFLLKYIYIKKNFKSFE